MKTHLSYNSGFKKLEVWHDAMELLVNVYRHTEDFPVRERYGITSQLRRAAASVPTNILRVMAARRSASISISCRWRGDH